MTEVLGQHRLQEKEAGGWETNMKFLQWSWYELTRPYIQRPQWEEKGRICVQALFSKIFLWPLVLDFPPLTII